MASYQISSIRLLHNTDKVMINNRLYVVIGFNY